MENPAPQPLDLAAALEQLGGDRDFLFEMLNDYKANLPERMKDIRAAFQDNNAKDLCRHAHNLKGISLNFHADPVVEIARQIEEAGKYEDLSNMPALVAQLEKEVQRLDEYLASLNV